MVQRLTTELVARGALVVIVSVASRNSYKLFARLGFVPIDKPVLLNKYDKQILNMGLVLGAGHKSEFTEQFLFQPPVYIHENQKGACSSRSVLFRSSDTDICRRRLSRRYIQMKKTKLSATALLFFCFLNVYRLAQGDSVLTIACNSGGMDLDF